jgi:histidyl-tRNA synthetase
MKKERLKLQTPQGMPDILPEDQPYFKKVLETAEEIAQFYGFGRIDPPILEYTQLFEKGTGQSTEIVQKQMYTLRTKGGDYLTLRPEFTPSIARAYIEHGMQSWPQPVKLFCAGPLFRHERPQAGRFRQFHQFNLEILGSKKPIVDVEIIYIFYNILKALGLKNLIIEINSIGDSQCRPYYKKILVHYLKNHEQMLCSDCKKRLKRNPLRILDCKQIKCQKVASQAPQVIDHLCDECHNHFEKVLEFLDELNLPYHLNPYLVRGLDYYTKTVFEIVEQDEGKEGSLVGGGRYDDLLKLLSRKEIPGCGGAGGVERIVSVIKRKEIKVKKANPPQVFLAQLGDVAKVRILEILEELRRANILAGHLLSKDSLSSQLKIADRRGAKFAVIIGQEEAKKEEAIIRDMEKGSQKIVKAKKIIPEIKRLIKKSKK